MDKPSMKAFLRDQQGSVLTLLAAGMVMVVGFTAFAVDAGYLYALRSKLQATADAAALAGAKQLPDPAALAPAADTIPAAVTIAAIYYAGKNMPAADHGTVLTNADVVIGNWQAGTRTFTPAGDPLNAVRVVTQRSDDNGNPVGLFFGRALGIVNVNVSTMAIARRTTPDCVISLSLDQTGIMVNSQGDITTENCGIHANSTDYNSIVTNSGSNITVNGYADICTAGDYEGSGYSPFPTTGCEIKSDPMASLSPPTFGSCDHTDKVVVQNGDTATLSPGRYCKGLEINSNGTANFEPGTYIIEGDGFTVNSNSTAEGTGVSFYMRDTAALVLFNSQSHVELSAPTSGDMAGVLLYVDRDIGELTKHEINSDSTSQFNGAIYMPESELIINSDGQMGGPGSCTNYVVGNLVVNSHSALYIDQDYATCGVPLPDGISNGVQLVR